MKISSEKNAINKEVKIRLLLMSILMAIIFVLLGLNLCYLMIEKGDYYNKLVLSKRQTSYLSENIQSKRGDIIDDKGNILATSIKVYNLILDPKVINSYNDKRYVNATINALSDYFSYDKWELRNIIEEKKDKSYVRYKKEISKEEKEKFEKFKDDRNNEYRLQNMDDRVNGVWFEEEYKRYYPYNSLASNVIGFVNNNGNSVMGLELYYDSILSGTNGRKYGYLGFDYELENVTRKAVDGYNIVTSLNLDMQRIVEAKLDEWDKGEIGSKSASAIIMNPNNGEILAMASTNGFDLNNPRDITPYTEEEVEEIGIENIWYSRWYNRCVQDTFEPGSTSKVVTLGATIEENMVSEDTVFDCKGYIELDDGENQWRIKCNNRNGHGKLSLMESLTKSCNMSMAEMGEMLGVKNFAKYQKTFGFGEYTNIDLPYEADTSSLVYDKNSMGRTALSTNAFGQNFNCTMIQMITAFSAAINGGKYYTPHIIKRIENNKGTYLNEIGKNEVRNTISSSTSKYLREALFETVESGTGKLAQIRGRNIGGKTGTAEKLPRADKNYLVSFIGFDDKDTPNLVLYVVIDQPKLEGEEQANASFATKIFHDIMKEVLALT